MIKFRRLSFLDVHRDDCVIVFPMVDAVTAWCRFVVAFPRGFMVVFAQAGLVTLIFACNGIEVHRLREFRVILKLHCTFL